MFSTLLKIELIKKNLTMTQLADILGTTQQNLSQKVIKDNWKEKDIIEICHALNCEIKMEIVEK